MRVRSHAPLLYLGMAAAGLCALALVGTYTYLMWADGRAGVLVAIVVTPFLLAGSALAFFGSRAFVRAALLGSWRLDLPDGGCALGRTVSVTLSSRREVTPTGELQCRLRCVRYVPRGAHSASGADVTTLWQTSWTIPPTTIHPTRGLALTLEFPETGAATHVDRKAGANIVWQLNVVIPARDTTEEPIFDLPVSPRSGSEATAP